jgi:parvulin-like peptidyl-prolyl isomerase
MTKHKITIVSIILGSIVIIGFTIATVSGIFAATIIRDRQAAPQPSLDSSPPVLEITLEIELDLPGLTTSTPSNELVEQIHVRYILTSDKSTANDVLAKLKSGANWDEMCRQYSIDEVAIRTGCDVGWFHRGVMFEEIDNLAFSAPVGEFRGPVQIEYGWIIIQVLEREMRPYSEGSR